MLIIKSLQMFDQEIYSKREQFRSQIRRRQIQQIFSKRRSQLQQEKILQQKAIIMRELQTEQSRKQWINQKAQEMGSQPRKDWFHIIRTLSISTEGFDQNFSQWIKAGIIRNLTLTFKQQYKQLGLAEISALTMQDIFYNLPYKNAQINQIIEYQFFLDLVELCVPNQTSAANYFQLINIIIYSDYSLRNTFIDQGLVQVLVNKLKTYTDYESDEVYVSLVTVYRLVRIFEVNGVRALPKGNVISILIPILDVCLLLVKREDSLSAILKAFCCLANTEKQNVLADLFNCSNLVSFCFHLLQVPGNANFRAAAASILACIASSNKALYSEQLVKKGILNALLMCSKMPNNQHICIRSILHTISNIAINSLEQSRAVLNHDIFAYFVIPCINSSQSKQSQLSIYIISTLIYRENYIMNETLIKKFKILNIFVDLLTKSAPNLVNCIEILRCLQSMVKMYEQVYSGAQNKIIQDLERIYNISNVLTSLQYKIDNKKLQIRINKLHEVLYGS